jgi:hypothetical protein
LTDAVKNPFNWKFIISHLVTLAASFMVFQSTVGKTDADILSTVLNRLEVIETQNEKLQEKLLILGAENVKLKMQLSENVTRVDLYQSFLDFLPFPAWIKTRDDDGHFRMLMINNAYVYKYGVSKARYLGAKDSEVWSKQIAEGFKQADQAAFDSKNFVRTREMVPSGGVGTPAKPARGWKFAVKLGSDTVGVGGVIVLDGDEVEAGEP